MAIEACHYVGMPRGRRAELEEVAEFRKELRRFLRRSELVAAESQLTSERYDLLLMIHASPAGEVRVTDLCELLQMQQSAVSELVKRAEVAGLIARSQSKHDGRVSLLRLTNEGRTRLLAALGELRGDREALARSLQGLA